MDLSRDTDPMGSIEAAEAFLLAAVESLAVSGETYTATYVAPYASDGDLAVLETAKRHQPFARGPSRD